jgi:general secretion pathway protein A
MVRELARVLVDQHALGRRVLVVIDEAQNLPRRTLEEVRMLSNLETEKSKLMQILLVGQPNFRATHLEPLDADATAGYINHRLRLAAIDTPPQLSRAVTDAIHTRSGGVPRVINVICDAILLAGYGDEQRTISLALTHSVFEDLERMALLAPRPGPVLATTTPPAAEKVAVPARPGDRVAAWPGSAPAGATLKDTPR